MLCCRAMLQVPVELGSRRYVVSVGRGLARQLPRLLAPFAGRRIALVAGRRVLALHGAPVRRALAALGPVHVVSVPDGERYKTARTLGRIHDGLVAGKLGRDGLVVAL